MSLSRSGTASLVLAIALAACGGGTPTAPADLSPNKVTLISDAGEFIGAGKTYSYSNTNAIIQVSGTASAITVRLISDQTWNATFAAATGTQLSTKSYSAGPPTNASMIWDGDGRSCGGITGSFTIDGMTWSGAVGSTLLSLDMSFEQHCGGGPGALHGAIHWRAGDLTTPPGPVAPVPAYLWQPPAGATPATGDYLYIQSDTADIGHGYTALIQAGITVHSSGASLAIAGGGLGGNFVGMNSISQIQAGYYGNLQRYPFNNPTLGGIEFIGPGGLCNKLAGWFAVDRVSYVNGAIAGLQLRFEQHCNGSGAALHGALRWGTFAG